MPTLDAGGAENYALRFINYCKEEYTFHVVSLVNRRGDLHDKFESNGSTIYYKPIGYLNFLKIYQFIKFLKINEFNTIATFNGNFGGIFMATAKMAGIENRIALYRRSTIAYRNNFFKSAYTKIITYLVRRYATKILSNSEFALKNFHPNYYLNDRRYKVIANGVDSEKFISNLSIKEARKKLGITTDSLIIGNVGRFDPAKNHKTIFKVAGKILEFNKKILFLFCGKGTDSQSFKNELITYGIDKHSIALGLQNDLPTVYRAIDIFYFPSLTEGQPNALIEAMLAGIPIVASNIEPIKEIVPDELHGNLLDPLNTNENFNFMLKVITDMKLRQRLIKTEWAKRKFDKDTNFGLFKDEI